MTVYMTYVGYKIVYDQKIVLILKKKMTIPKFHDSRMLSSDDFSLQTSRRSSVANQQDCLLITIRIFAYFQTALPSGQAVGSESIIP
jgi:hypothetical protein